MRPLPTFCDKDGVLESRVSAEITELPEVASSESGESGVGDAMDVDEMTPASSNSFLYLPKRSVDGISRAKSCTHVVAKNAATRFKTSGLLFCESSMPGVLIRSTGRLSSEPIGDLEHHSTRSQVLSKAEVRTTAHIDGL